MKKLTAVLASLTMLALVQLTGPANASSSQMSVERAGRYYLRHVSASNHAFDRFNAKIWKGRRTIKMAEIRRRLPQIRSESRRLGRAQHRFAAALYNPPADWPGIVRGNIRTMAGKTSHDSNILLDMGDANTARRWAVLNGRHNSVNNSANATSGNIRAKLDLPAPGQGCG